MREHRPRLIRMFCAYRLPGNLVIRQVLIQPDTLVKAYISDKLPREVKAANTGTPLKPLVHVGYY